MQIYRMPKAYNDIWISQPPANTVYEEMASNKNKQVLIAYNGPSIGLNVLH